MTTDRRIVRSIRHVPTLVKMFNKSEPVLDMPYLIQMSRDSYQRFLNTSLRQLFDEISPIDDFTGGRMELRFGEYHLEEPKYSERECRDRDYTYAAPLRVLVELLVKESGEVKEQELFLGDLPQMTEHGTFIINGAERVVVSQLVRSPGVYFTASADPATGRRLTSAKLIPNRGAWLEFETDKHDVLYVKVDRKRRIPATVLLRAIDNQEDADDEQLGTTNTSAPCSRKSTPTRTTPTSTPRSRRIHPRTASRRWRSSTVGCGPATRRPRRTRTTSFSSCSSPSAATTWDGWDATRSTSGSRSPTPRRSARCGARTSSRSCAG